MKTFFYCNCQDAKTVFRYEPVFGFFLLFYGDGESDKRFAWGVFGGIGIFFSGSMSHAQNAQNLWTIFSNQGVSFQ